MLTYAYNLSLKKYILYRCSTDTSGQVEIPTYYNDGTHGEAAVNEIRYSAFSDCTLVTEVIIPDTVTDIGYSAFYNCTSLENVTIGNNVSSIGHNAFWNCSSLISITIPDSVTNIGSYAFSNCTSLKNIILPNNNTINIESGVFYNTAFESFIIPSNASLINASGDPADYVLSECSQLNTVIWLANNQHIGDGCFSHCDNLTNLLILGDNNVIDRHGLNFIDSSHPKTNLYLTKTTSLSSRCLPYGYLYPALNIYFNGTKAEWDELVQNVDYLDDQSWYKLYKFNFLNTDISEYLEDLSSGQHQIKLIGKNSKNSELEVVSNITYIK